MNSRHFEPTGPNFIHHEFTFLRSPCLKTALIFHQILVTNSTGKYMYLYSYGDNFAGQLLLYVAIGASMSRAKQVYWLNFNVQRSWTFLKLITIFCCYNYWLVNVLINLLIYLFAHLYFSKEWEINLLLCWTYMYYKTLSCCYHFLYSASWTLWLLSCFFLAW